MYPRFRLAVLLLALCFVPGLAFSQGTKAYPFIKPAAQAFEVLNELSKVSGEKVSIAAIEQELFADLAAERKERWSPAAIVLVASGVLDRTELADCLKRLDTLEADARRSLASAKTDRAKGEQLLKFLHAGVMVKGYELKQTSLSALLKENRFNCVSSAAMYNLLGERLGLNVRAIEIPATVLSGHVFSVLRADGAVIDVETTNKLGFNPKGKRERPEGGTYDPAKDGGNRREVDNQQLAAMIYYNRGVELSKEKQYHPALFMYFRALCLDATNKAAIGNVLADLSNWGLALSKQGKHEDGLHVYAVAMKLAPNESGLQTNHVAIWQHYALAEMRAGREDAALTVAKRASQAAKHRDLVELPAGLYLRSGEDFIKAGRYLDAITQARRGLAKLDASQAKQVDAWVANAYLRWSDAHRKSGNWSQAFDALTMAKKDYPQDDRFESQGLYLAQELLKQTAAKEPARLAECIAQLRKEQPQLKDLDKAIINLVRLEVRQHTDKKQYEAALKLLDGRKSLIENAKEAEAVAVSVYDQWARSRKAEGWKPVMEIYAAGLKNYPGQELLKRNAEATCDAQGVPLMNAKKWAEAIEIYEAGLRIVPGNAFLEGRLQTCKKKR